MASNTTMIHRLQSAINSKGCKLLYSSSQFYSVKQERPVTTYYIKQAYVDEETGKTKSNELFKSTSQIQIVLFLRDYWFQINGWEVPTDNKDWQDKKQQYYNKGD